MAELICHNDTAPTQEERMKTQQLNGSVELETYFKFIRQHIVVLIDNIVLEDEVVHMTVVSKPQNQVLKVMIETRKEAKDDDPWYCFLELPIDMLVSFFMILPKDTTIAQAFVTRIPWYVEGITEMAETQNLLVQYTMPKEKALKLFGEDWHKYFPK